MEVLRLTLRQLQIFAAVAGSGSTTAASRAISLSQSATSSAVSELERLLALKLFDRAGKRLQLNDNGRALLPRALALLDGATAIEQLTRDGSLQLQRLRIGASTTIGSYVLPALLGRFLGSRPAIDGVEWKSSARIGNTAAICQAVAAFELDVGLIEGPCHQPSLRVSPWLRDNLLIVASPRARLPARLSLRALRERVWLLRELGSGTREATDQLLLPRLRSYPRSIELASSEAIKHAAAAGLGIACLSAWVVDEMIAAGRLKRVATTLPPLARQCYVVLHRDKQPTAALAAFLDTLASLPQPMHAGDN